MRRQRTRLLLAIGLSLLAGMGPAPAADAPRASLRPGVWQHSALDAQGRPDPASTLAICESRPSHADLWNSIAREELGEGCGPRRMGWRNGQITVEQTCTEDADTVVTHTTVSPVKAEDGIWTAYRTTSTRTARNRQRHTLATATEVSLHTWLHTCALRDDGQTTLPTATTPEKTR
jgi:hypothetical protein